MNEITIGDKTYISSKRAAEITGYAKDYVGQLCREGYVDAKMVGRSWYVYEPSIRAHRFGEEATAETEPDKVPELSDEDASGTKDEPEEPILATWEQPVYIAEQSVSIPTLEVRESRTVNRMEDPEYAPEEALTDMQQAWKEWFELRSMQAKAETPDAEIEEDEDEIETEDAYEDIYEEETVEIQRIAELEEEPEDLDEEPEVLEEVRIERVYHREVPRQEAVAPRTVPAAAPVRPIKESKVRKSSEGAAASIAALFISIAILSVSIAAIGSGVATPYIESLLGSNPVLDYLGGSRTINNY